MDVTNEHSVRSGVIGFLEHFTIDDFQKLFDINVYGVHRVNRAVLPHLRKQGSGLLIHVSACWDGLQCHIAVPIMLRNRRLRRWRKDTDPNFRVLALSP